MQQEQLASSITHAWRSKPCTILASSGFSERNPSMQLLDILATVVVSPPVAMAPKLLSRSRTKSTNPKIPPVRKKANCPVPGIMDVDSDATLSRMFVTLPLMIAKRSYVRAHVTFAKLRKFEIQEKQMTEKRNKG